MLKGAQAYNVWLSFTNTRDSTLVTTIRGTSHVQLLWGCCVQSPIIGQKTREPRLQVDDEKEQGAVDALNEPGLIVSQLPPE
jgi:hypothetical protein